MKQNAIMTGITNASSAAWIPPTVTFASPPASPVSGTLYLFTDAASSGANSGGGSSLSQCVWSGSAWLPTSGAPAVGPAGSNTQVQYNNAGAFGADAGLTWSAPTLGIQSSALTPLLNITGTGQSPAISLTCNGGSSCTITASSYSGSSGNTALQVTILSARGTSVSAPAATQSGDWFLRFLFQGYTGSGNQSAGSIDVKAESNWSTSANPIYIAFSTAATGSPVERMRIASSGNVGIGTNSPVAKLDVRNSIFVGNTDWAAHTGSGMTTVMGASSGNTYVSLQAYTAGSDSAGNIVLQNGGGNVGIGTTSPQRLADLYAPSASAQLRFSGNPASTYYYEMGRDNVTTGNFYISRAVGGSAFQDFTINTNGYVIINGAIGVGMTPSYQIQLSTDSAAKPGTSTWTIASDERVKRNIRDLCGGLDVINRLRPVEAEYNGMAGTPAGARAVGFLAHEVQQVLPHCVTSRPETGILDLNIHELLIHLILAVQQLSQKTN